MRHSDDAGVAVEVEIAEIKPVAVGSGVVCSGGCTVYWEEGGCRGVLDRGAVGDVSW